MKIRSHLILGWAVLLVVGCGGDSPTAPIEPPPNPDRDGDGILNVVDACPDQPETFNNVWDQDGCPDTPEEFYQAVRVDVETFWVSQFGDPPYFGIGLFQGYSGSFLSACGLVARGAFYCSTDAGVYYETGFIGEFLNAIGDMAPAFIIAHEIGHHVSWQLGWTLVLTVKKNELQADCFSGAWAADADARGLLEQGDLEEAVTALIAVSDPASTWFDPTMHGTPLQRVLAFAVGFEDGAATCASFEFTDLFPILADDSTPRQLR